MLPSHIQAWLETGQPTVHQQSRTSQEEIVGGRAQRSEVIDHTGLQTVSSVSVPVCKLSFLHE